MTNRSKPPAGPRGAVGASAETAAAVVLAAQGWSVVARNVRLGRDEVDLIGIEPGTPPTLVFVEVRSRSGPGFGSPRESVDRRKVDRLYRVARTLIRSGHPDLDVDTRSLPWRVDLLALTRAGRGAWRVEGHVRGLQPP